MVLWPRPRAGRQRWVGHDLGAEYVVDPPHEVLAELHARCLDVLPYLLRPGGADDGRGDVRVLQRPDRKSTRLNSSHSSISYAVFCLKKKKNFQTHSLLYKKKKNK